MTIKRKRNWKSFTYLRSTWQLGTNLRWEVATSNDLKTVQNFFLSSNVLTRSVDMQSRSRLKMNRRLVHRNDEHKLQISATQPPKAGDTTQNIFLLEYDGVGKQFLNHVIFSRPQNNLRIHLFFNKTEKSNIKISQLRKSFGKSIVLHESLTESKEASWTDMLAYLINFYTKTLISCHHCAVIHPRPSYHVTLVANQEGRYSELKALLKSNKAETKIVDGWKMSILDSFDHVCHDCKIIFPNKDDAETHDKQHHNFLCKNKSCERSLRENGFFSRNELLQHEEKQRTCGFCAHAFFCDLEKYTEHMQTYHILCDCSCGKYYRNTVEFIEHYCSCFPLPCLEAPECEARFKNIDEQAFHHKTSHGSAHPYFCIACYSNSKLVCLRTSEELMAHVSEANHKENDFDVVIIPDETSDNDDLNL